MAASSTDTPGSASAGLDPVSAQPLDLALRAAAVHAAALTLVNTAQHLQRTTMLVEAATAEALARVAGDIDRSGEARPDGQDIRLDVARFAMAEAWRLFEGAQAVARDLGRAPGGT